MSAASFTNLSFNASVYVTVPLIILSYWMRLGK
nr:MAG TPA: hypothetical protein [Caudoviricetes sp.]